MIKPKPSAARGKTTRKGTLTKAVKQIRKILESMEDPSKGKGMSPGAMGGKTKPKPSSPFLRRRMKLKAAGMAPMVGTAAGAAGKGSGKSLSRAGMAGMSKAVFNEAKKRKPSGRLNVDDIKRTREMLKKRKGK
jgi:hypothetical protein